MFLSNNRSEHGCKAESSDGTIHYSEEEILLVMKIAGFSKKDAIRALLVRDELVKLRKKGLLISPLF